MGNSMDPEKDVETPIGEAAPDDGAQHTETSPKQEDTPLQSGDKEKEGEDGNAPRLSNLALLFWSRLDVATQLFDDDRDDECREMVLETLMRARVPHACRCELLQLLACVMPWEQGQACLDEADELCDMMERLVPGSEQVMKLRAKGVNVRQAVKEYHEARDDDESTPEESGQDDGQSC